MTNWTDNQYDRKNNKHHDWIFQCIFPSQNMHFAYKIWAMHHKWADAHMTSMWKSSYELMNIDVVCASAHCANEHDGRCTC